MNARDAVAGQLMFVHGLDDHARYYLADAALEALHSEGYVLVRVDPSDAETLPAVAKLEQVGEGYEYRTPKGWFYSAARVHPCEVARPVPLFRVVPDGDREEQE